MDVLISMPFESKYDPVYEAIVAAVAESGLTADRVDKANDSSVLVPLQIQKAIRDCRVMVADATEANPNVMNEIGWAQALGKPLAIICQCPPEKLPFNIRALGVHRYDLGDLGALRDAMKRVLGPEKKTTSNETLRAMLVPRSLGTVDAATRFIIAASPLSHRRATGGPAPWKMLRRTSSDYLGMRGILQAFGVLYGFDALPDLLDPDDCADEVLQEPMNLYCIASPKANAWTGHILRRYSEQWRPAVRFLADPVTDDLRNLKISLHFGDRREPYKPSDWEVAEEEDRAYHDFGIVLRGPNPAAERCMVTVLAGRSRLGTEAACMAFTDPEHIAVVRRRLEARNVDLDDHRQPFYAVFSLQREREGKLESMPETLRLEELGVLTPRRHR